MALQSVMNRLRRPAAEPPEPSPRTLVDRFHQLYYDSKVWESTTWRGVATQKCPLDLWVYQEILSELRPDVIVETGTLNGGSAYFMASICDLIGTGRIVTVDLERRPGRPTHPRITYVEGWSSTAPEAVARVREAIRPGEAVMVILDSDHSQAHVRDELDRYSGLVTPGQYLVVEDTNVYGHPVFLEHGPGPMEALDEFLPAHPEFAIDPAREKFFLTFNPRGFLKRLG